MIGIYFRKSDRVALLYGVRFCQILKFAAMKDKGLILVLGDITMDARVRRQIQFLSPHYDLTVVCFASPPSSDYQTVLLKPTRLTFLRKAFASVFLLARFYRVAHRILHNYLPAVRSLSGSYRFVIANDIESLPLAFAVKSAPPVLFDAHEYAPRHFENKRSWRIFFQGFNTFLCTKYLPRVSAMTTVSEGLACEYEKVFGVRPVVLSNATDFHSLSPSPVDPGKIRLVHHGVATPNRKLELMIDLFNWLDSRFELDMYLVEPPSASATTRHYPEVLKQYASGYSNVRILPPMKSQEIPAVINAYDIGLFLIPPVNFNYANTLPNKLFDFVQGRLGIAIGPTPDMQRVVERYQLGVVSETFEPESLARKLNALTATDVANYKSASHKAARELSSEKNRELIQELVRGILK